MPFIKDDTAVPLDYWANRMAAMMARLEGEPPATADQTRLLAAIDEINAGRGFPLSVEKIIVMERAAADGWRCSFLDGPLPASIGDYPILPLEERLAENAMAWGMNNAERLHGIGNT